MRILISGSSGLVGKQLCEFLNQGGHEIVRLVRSRQQLAPDAIYWNPETGDLNKDDFEGFDTVIHLAGANIAASWWTEKRKKQLFLTRCRDTWLLSHVLCRLYRPPQSLLCASAVGFYGDRGMETLTEQSEPGIGFLAHLCAKWEEATNVIESRGTRVVHFRFGQILSKHGGVLKKMLPLFRLGLGMKISDAHPFLSWVALEDVIKIIHFAMTREELSGALNVVAPESITQPQFADSLARHLGKKIRLKLPSWLIKLLLREMGQELFLSSTRAVPARLLERGYVFSCPTLDSFFS